MKKRNRRCFPIFKDVEDVKTDRNEDTDNFKCWNNGVDECQNVHLSGKSLGASMTIYWLVKLK